VAHELTPKPGRLPLSIAEITQRLRDAFAYVELDVERASRELAESARHMARTGWPHFTEADIQRAKDSIGRAVYVIVADDVHADVAYLSFLVEPDHERVFIGYESGAHEEASRELRNRLARILDYDIELV
jgi:hypothetical protein